MSTGQVKAEEKSKYLTSRDDAAAGEMEGWTQREGQTQGQGKRDPREGTNMAGNDYRNVETRTVRVGTVAKW